jgi:glycosyltransferase involved in cell wall biosynthesis
MSEQETAPLVSVIITVRNAEAFISETLASILQEREVSLEVVLVDNGCTDSTIDRAREFNDDRVRIIEGPRKGIAHALNVAYAAARGKVIVRCDGDDLYPPGRLVRQVRWLDEHPEFGAVCGRFTTIDPKGTPLADLSKDEPEEITEELRNGKLRTHIGTFAIRAEVVKAAGYSREYFDCFEDTDFQLRIGETCRVWFEPEIEYIYRLHQASSSHTTSYTKNHFYTAIAMEFQKQRRATGMDDLQRGYPPAVPDGPKAPFWDAASHMQKMLIAGAWADHQTGRKQQAVIKGLRSVKAWPFGLQGWRNLVFLVIKPAGNGTASGSGEVSEPG